MEFSRNLRGEYVIDGKATKNGSWRRRSPRDANPVSARERTLWRNRFPAVDGKDIGEAAKIVERSIAEALKGMPNYKDCISDLRAPGLREGRKGCAARTRGIQELCAIARLPVAGTDGAQGATRFDHREREGDSCHRLDESARPGEQGGCVQDEGRYGERRRDRSGNRAILISSNPSVILPI